MILFSKTYNKSKNNLDLKFEIIIEENANELILKSKHIFMSSYEIKYENIVSINKTKGTFKIQQEINKFLEKKQKVYNNKFDKLYEFSEKVLKKGYKSNGFWGVRYNKIIEEVNNIILKYKKECGYFNVDDIHSLVASIYINYNKIKVSDNILYYLNFGLPTKKVLNKNGGKFIPSLLETNHISNKFFISEFNQKKINLKTLKKICFLFGENYIDYIKDFDYKKICESEVKTKINFALTNTDKRNIVHIINMLVENNHNNPFESVIDMVNLTYFLQDKGMDIKIKKLPYKEFNEYLNLLKDYKKTYNKGYLMAYQFDEELLKEIEGEHHLNGDRYYCGILKSEEDFRNEGVLMKNCIKTHFNLGLYFLYFYVIFNNKRYNLQLKRGIISQGFGKANSELPEEVKPIFNDIEKKMVKFSTTKWGTTKQPLNECYL